MRAFRGGAAIDWLIVGLGNPGPEHTRTRHNAGFMVAEQLAELWRLPKPKRRFNGLLREGRVEGPALGDYRPRVALLCPQTYMNDAGRSVGPARGSYRLALARVLVIHDEIDLPFGEIRSRLGGGLAGHNGLKSLKRELGSADFWRVRIGVGRPDTTDPAVVASYVLGRFTESQQDVGDLIQRAVAETQNVMVREGS